jgi:2-polyprenyl-6-methoxyphenol hydroxylase-like FAD-dependent oxidoreductase
MWSPMSATLIHCEHDAVLVDTLVTFGQVDALADWIGSFGNRLSAIYITHGHADHWIGLSRLLERFPDARALATGPVRERAVFEATNPGLSAYWQSIFAAEVLRTGMREAQAAGAEAWVGAKVTALVRDRGRVNGVRVARDGSEQALQARLVVGADGRNSTVARLAGSRKYNLIPNERAFYRSFFEGADPGDEPTVVFHRWSGNFVFAIPADSGLYQVGVLPELSELPRFRQSLEEGYLEYVRRCAPGPPGHRLARPRLALQLAAPGPGRSRPCGNRPRRTPRRRPREAR